MSTLLINHKVLRVLSGVCLIVSVLGGIGGAAVPSVLSQDDSGACPTLVTDAMAVVGTSCAAMGRNEACYGHMLVAATFQENTSGGQFETNGDVTPLVDLQALVTQPADPDAGTWGVALMKVQADLPDESDAAMTFVLFGDTQVTSTAASAPSLATCQATNGGGGNINVRGGPGTDRAILDVLPAGEEVTANGRNEVSDWLRIERNGAQGWVSASLVTLDCPVETLSVVEEGAPAAIAYDRPMQAIVLQSGTTSRCEEAPDGLLIQSSSGQRAHVMVNGVQLEFSSSAFLTAQPDGNLTITGLEGQIAVTAFDKTVTVTSGYRTTVPLTGLEASGPPTDPVQVENIGSVPGLLQTAVHEQPLDLNTPVEALGVPIAGTWRVVDPNDYTVTCTFGRNERELGDDIEVTVEITIAEDGSLVEGWGESGGSNIYPRIGSGIYQHVLPIEDVGAGESGDWTYTMYVLSPTRMILKDVDTYVYSAGNVWGHAAGSTCTVVYDDAEYTLITPAQ